MSDPRLPDLLDRFSLCESCCLSESPYSGEDIEDILVWRVRGNGDWSDAPGNLGPYEDNDGYAVVRLKDGRFGTLEEWEDSSGHGCQCGASATAFPTMEEAVRLGLSEETRDDFCSLGEE